MTVTVLAIFDEFNLNAPLAKVLKERLIRLAAELQDSHLKPLTQCHLWTMMSSSI